MAKYTELFSEWLEAGGELPPEFSQIAGFDNLFVGEYADSEIGFETPSLFQLKLNQRATLIIPEYVTRIAEIEAARTNLENPVKIRTKTGQITRITGAVDNLTTDTQNGEKSTHTIGDTTQSNPDHVRTVSDQPFIAQAATPPADGTTSAAQVTPTSITVDKAFENDTTHDDHTTTENYTNYVHTVHEEDNARTDTERYDEVKDTESGYTVDEAERIYKDFERDVFNIKKQLLSEFRTLFLMVY